jgi:hypothetical protein
MSLYKKLSSFHLSVFGDALLASPPKAREGYCRNVPSSTLTLNNRFGKRAAGDLLLMFSFFQRRHPKAKSTDNGMSSGRKFQRCLNRAFDGGWAIVGLLTDLKA